MLFLHDLVAHSVPKPGKQVNFELWKLDMKEFWTKLQEYGNLCAGLHSLVLGQCTESLQDHLKSHQDFPAANKDGIALLVLNKSLMHTFQEQHKSSDVLTEVKALSNILSRSTHEIRKIS